MTTAKGHPLPKRRDTPYQNAGTPLRDTLANNQGSPLDAPGSPTSDFARECEYQDAAIRRLLLAVVARAVRDAAITGKDIASSSIRRRAREWLLADGWRFAQACGLRITRRMIECWIEQDCPKPTRSIVKGVEAL